MFFKSCKRGCLYPQLPQATEGKRELSEELLGILAQPRGARRRNTEIQITCKHWMCSLLSKEQPAPGGLLFPLSGESSSTWGDALTADRRLGRRQTPSIRRQFQGVQSVLHQGALQRSLDPVLACAIYKRKQMGVDSSEPPGLGHKRTLEINCR